MTQVIIENFIFFITNNIYYSMTGTFFYFILLLLASEGSEYFLDAILKCNILVYISSIIIIVCFIFGIKYFKENKKTNLKRIIKTVEKETKQMNVVIIDSISRLVILFLFKC